MQCPDKRILQSVAKMNTLLKAQSIMPLTLIGSPKSTCTLKTLLTLAEKNVTDYNFISLDLSNGEQSTPTYLAKQPFGVVPVLEDGDFRLYESRAICRYLAKKYENQGIALLPDLSDLQEMGRFEQWVNVEVANFDNLARDLQMRLIFDPLKDTLANGKLVSNVLERLDKKLDIYESAILSKQAYMAGDEFSLVDIFYMPLIAYLFTMGHGYLVNRRPLLRLWWERVSSRPSWKAFGVDAQVNLE